MGVHVVDTDEGDPKTDRESLGGVVAHSEGAGHSWASGGGDEVRPVVGVQGEAFLDEGCEVGTVRIKGDDGVDATVDTVGGGDGTVVEKLGCGCRGSVEEGDGGVVAGRC